MASVMIGTHKCPMCGGKTHVKVKDEEGKKAYSHCLDEFDKGCSHTGHATNSAQDRLLRAVMKPIKPLGEGAPTPSPTLETPASKPELTATATPSATPTQGSATPTAKRSALFGL